MPDNNKLYQEVMASLGNQLHPKAKMLIVNNKKQIDTLHKKVKDLEARPAHKYFYYKPQKKALKHEIWEWTVRGIIVALTSVLVARALKTKTDSTAIN